MFTSVFGTTSTDAVKRHVGLWILTQVAPCGEEEGGWGGAEVNEKVCKSLVNVKGVVCAIDVNKQLQHNT